MTNATSAVHNETARNLAYRPVYEHCSSFADAKARADRSRDECSEIQVAEADIRFDVKSRVTIDLKEDKAEGIEVVTSAGSFRPTPYFLQQLASRTGVGVRIMPKLDPTTLANALAQTWDSRDEDKEEGPKDTARKLLIRNGTDVRAMTSTTYARLWDAQILDLADTWLLPEGKFIPATPTINTSFAKKTEGGEMKPALFIGDRSSHFFFYSTDRDDRNGGMRTGLTINNSEVGANVFSFNSFLFMEMCANFLIWSPKEIRQWVYRHTRGGIEEGFKRFQAVMCEITGFVADTMTEALETAKGIEFVPVTGKTSPRWTRKAAKTGEDAVVLTRDESAAQRIVRTTGLSVGQARRGVEAAKLERNNLGTDPYSLFSMVQGVTDAAKDEPMQDNAVDMIERGSNLLDLVYA